MWKQVGKRLSRLARAARLARRRARRGFLTPRVRRTDPPKIDVSRVGHRFGNQVVALRDVNIEVHAGEFVCLVGPSGCGKTTLLYALAGHLEPSGGRITIDGLQVKGPGPSRLLVFQEPALFPWLTVRQNLVFPLRARGLSRAAADARAREYVSRVHLDGFEETLPHQLSGGMRMRVQLARALALDPAVLLMDEPFASLDAQTREIMQQELLRIWNADRKTVLFITHQIDEAIFLADRVIVLTVRPGRVKTVIPVPFQRPRRLEIKRTPEFIGYVDQVWRLIEQEVRESVMAGQD